jgi:hypothetical protein
MTDASMTAFGRAGSSGTAEVADPFHLDIAPPQLSAFCAAA